MRKDEWVITWNTNTAVQRDSITFSILLFSALWRGVVTVWITNLNFCEGDNKKIEFTLSWLKYLCDFTHIHSQSNLYPRNLFKSKSFILIYHILWSVVESVILEYENLFKCRNLPGKFSKKPTYHVVYLAKVMKDYLVRFVSGFWQQRRADLNGALRGCRNGCIVSSYGPWPYRLFQK